MNFKKDFSREKQNLLTQLNVAIEDKEYSSEEIKTTLNELCSHVMSKSSKNGDLSKEMIKYNEIMNTLIKNEK